MDFIGGFNNEKPNECRKKDPDCIWGRPRICERSAEPCGRFFLRSGIRREVPVFHHEAPVHDHAQAGL